MLSQMPTYSNCIRGIYSPLLSLQTEVALYATRLIQPYCTMLGLVLCLVVHAVQSKNRIIDGRIPSSSVMIVGLLIRSPIEPFANSLLLFPFVASQNTRHHW